MPRSAFYLVVDNKYFPIAFSLGLRLQKLWQIDVHIFLEDNITSFQAHTPSRSIFIHQNRLQGLRPSNLPETHNWPAIVYDRIFAPRFLGSYDRLIYLDADIYPVFKSSEILRTPLPGGLGAVQDSASIGFSPQAASASRDVWRASIGLNSDRYFNSGFLIIDPSIWSKIDFSLDLVKYASRYGSGVRMPDQDFLNWRFQNEWTEFSPRMNFQKALFNYGYEDWFPPAFLHFSSFQKPWLKPDSKESVHGQFFEVFQDMIRTAGFNPKSLQTSKHEALLRRLRKAIRQKMSAYGFSSGKERRLRMEWNSRASLLYEGFVQDLKTGRYADVSALPAEQPQPNLDFDGQYLRRSLKLKSLAIV